MVHLEQYRDSSPAVPEEHPNIDMDDLEAEALADQQLEEEQEALIAHGLSFVYSPELNPEEAMEYAFNTRAAILPDEPKC